MLASNQSQELCAEKMTQSNLQENVLFEGMRSTIFQIEIGLP